MKVIFTLSKVLLILTNVLCYIVSNKKHSTEEHCRDQDQGDDYDSSKYTEISDANMKRENFRLKLPAVLGIVYLN